VRIDEEILWVSAEGDVLNGSGRIVKGLTVDLTTKVVTDMRVVNEESSDHVT
jgi:hypothetical protein